MTAMDRLRMLLRKITRSKDEPRAEKVKQDSGVVDDAKRQREHLNLAMNERERLDEMVMREFRARVANDLRRE